MIQKESPIPIYYQLEQYIRSLITGGTLQPRDLLPSERELSEQFAISRMTVRQAISNLVQEGLLVKERGKGTFVAEKKIEKGVSVYSFSEEMRRRNMAPGSHVLSLQTVAPPESVQTQLGIGAQELVYEIRRLRLADDEPMAIETAYVPCKFVPQLTVEALTGSLYEILRENNVPVTGMERFVEAALPTQEEAKLLGIRSSQPVLFVVGCAYAGQHVVEYVKSTFRGDRYKFGVRFYKEGTCKS